MTKEDLNSDKKEINNSKIKKEGITFKQFLIYSLFMNLLVIGLLLGGAYIYLSQPEVVASVNDENILLLEVLQNQEQIQAQGQYMSQEQILEELILQKILMQKIREEELILPNKLAENELENELAEQNVTLQEYKNELKQSNMNYEQVLNEFTREFAIQTYLQDNIAYEQIEITQEEGQELYNIYLQQAGDEALSFEEVEQELFVQLYNQKAAQLEQEFYEVLINESDIVIY